MISNDNGATWKEVPELGSEAPAAKPTKETGLTPYQQTERKAKAAGLVGEITKARQEAEAAISQELSTTDDAEKAKLRGKYRDALTKGNAAAEELKSGYGDIYEAGTGQADTRGGQWPYYKPVSQSAPAITAPPSFVDAFKKKNGRPPTLAEIQAYAKAAGQ